MRRHIIALIAMLALAGCYDKPEVEPAKPAEILTSYKPEKANGFSVLPCEVVRVVDGDTIEVKFYAWSDIILQKMVRFEDIDTWEMRGEGKEKGKAAKAFLEKLLASGDVVLHTHRKKGKYGRLLGRVFIHRDDIVVSAAQELKAAGHEKTQD